MKKLILTSALIVTASASYAADFIPYTSIKGGIANDLINIVDGNISSAAFMASVGAKTIVSGISLRGELEYTRDYNKTELHYSKLGSYGYDRDITKNTNQVQANVFIDFLTEYKIKPYIGYGLGYANTKTKTQIYDMLLGWVDTSFHNDYFAHGFLLGFSFDITDSLSGDVGMRWMNLSNYKKDSDLPDHYTNISQNLITAGIRYTF